MQERNLAIKCVALGVVLVWALTACAAPPAATPTVAPAPPTSAPAAATTAPTTEPTAMTAATPTTAPTATSAPTATAAPTVVPTASPAMAGAVIYHFSCQVCHGPDAAGGIKVGGAVSADLRWKTLGSTYKNDANLLRTSIENSVDEEGKPLDPAMPKWKDTLTDAQVNDVIAYLQSGPSQPVTATTALTSTTEITTTAMVTATMEGQALYSLSCQECHRPDGSGGVKVGGAVSADLRWQTLGSLYKNDNALIARAIEEGLDQDGKSLDPAMPRWKGTLADEQVMAIVNYLQTLK